MSARGADVFGSHLQPNCARIPLHARVSRVEVLLQASPTPRLTQSTPHPTHASTKPCSTQPTQHPTHAFPNPRLTQPTPHPNHAAPNPILTTPPKPHHLKPHQPHTSPTPHLTHLKPSLPRASPPSPRIACWTCRALERKQQKRAETQAELAVVKSDAS